MEVTIHFDYILSEWQIVYTEGTKAHISSSGRTLGNALENLRNHHLASQIMVWYGMNPQAIGNMGWWINKS